MAAVMVYVTCRDEAEAERIARAALGERLAACANILGAVRSLYWWQGKLEEAGEIALLLKTRQDLADKLTARVRELHSYDVPDISALPIVAGNPDYLAWIAAETR